MNPVAVARADIISVPTTTGGEVSATAKKMDIISGMLQISIRSAKNGGKKNEQNQRSLCSTNYPDD